MFLGEKLAGAQKEMRIGMTPRTTIQPMVTFLRESQNGSVHFSFPPYGFLSFPSAPARPSPLPQKKKWFPFCGGWFSDGARNRGKQTKPAPPDRGGLLQDGDGPGVLQPGDCGLGLFFPLCSCCLFVFICVFFLFPVLFFWLLCILFVFIMCFRVLGPPKEGVATRRETQALEPRVQLHTHQ